MGPARRRSPHRDPPPEPSPPQDDPVGSHAVPAQGHPRVPGQEKPPPPPHPHLPDARHCRARHRRRPAHRLQPHRLGRRLDRYSHPTARPLGLDGNQARRRPESTPPDRHRKNPGHPENLRSHPPRPHRQCQRKTSRNPFPRCPCRYRSHRSHRHRRRFPNPPHPRRRISIRHHRPLRSLARLRSPILQLAAR